MKEVAHAINMPTCILDIINKYVIPEGECEYCCDQAIKQLTDDKDKPNTLVVVMNTFDSIMEEVEIPNIPLNKWINVVIRIKNRLLDVYINGTITVRHRFESPPRQNYGKLYVGMNGGFSGQLSSLKYYNRALSGVEIGALNNSGPNMKTDQSMHIFPPYFSLRWFFGN